MINENGERIVIVGPVSPYRSGVAKHTTELAVALEQAGPGGVKVYSFKRQYPRVLFPGESEHSPGSAALPQLQVEFSLDSLNPLSWRRVARAVRNTQPRLVIMPAWTFFLAPCLGFIARSCRKAGYPVVMVVHNVADHDASAWKAWLSRFQLRHASRFVTHGRALAEQLRALFPEKPVAVCPHPIFQHYPDPEGLLPRRAPLELLFFGLVRHYKGLDIALRGLAASGRHDVRLTVAGEFWEGGAQIEALIGTLGLKELVELIPRFVSDAEAAELFHRADVVVLPYRSVTGSGVVPVAFRYGKPVIVSDLPGLTEVVTDGETGWVIPVGDTVALGRLLEKGINGSMLGSMQSHLAEACKKLSWARFAETIL